MKTLLVGINSKFIHPNLSIRYLQANCDFDVAIKEFTIKDNIEYIYKEIISLTPNLVGISVYIWNIELVKVLISKIKTNNPNIEILLGGPEVSYEFDYLFENPRVDYIIRNEGEIAFNRLLHAIIEKTSLTAVPNLSFVKDNKIIHTSSKDILDLNLIKNPLSTLNDDYSHKIAYLELSRGCPFHCAYCLASLEKNVRFFEIERVKNDIVNLYKHGARTFKFLDRTFNIREDLAIELLDFIFQNTFDSAIFQFEINADILTEAFIQHMNELCPPNKIRFEIGIQSTNDLVNSAVDRRQDTQKLLHNIKELKKGNVIMHLDLIAGLPYEDLVSFKNTFDTVFLLYADELQLGFLKLLKGTKLFYNQYLHDYQVDKTSPYELLCNKYLSEKDLDKIHLVEDMLNIFWNKGFMNTSLELITNNLKSPFEFFYDLGLSFISKGLEIHRYQLFEIFQFIEEYISNEEYISEIRLDYLKYHKVKPKIYWDSIKNRNEILRNFQDDNPEYNIDSLYKYSIVTKYRNGYLIVVYFPNKTDLIKITNFR